jgi:hypothetical protein
MISPRKGGVFEESLNGIILFPLFSLSSPFVRKERKGSNQSATHMGGSFTAARALVVPLIFFVLLGLLLGAATANVSDRRRTDSTRLSVSAEIYFESWLLSLQVGDSCSTSTNCGAGQWCFDCSPEFSGSHCVRSAATDTFQLIVSAPKMD